MSALDDAGLDHASMAEALLTQGARSREQIELHRDKIATLRDLLGDAVDENVDYHDEHQAAARAQRDFDAAIATAQVHATLATVPRTLSAALGFGGYVENITNVTTERSADVRAGDRVVMLSPLTSNSSRVGRSYRTMGSDAFGTVVTIGPEADPRAVVDWDDIGTDCEPTPVSQLRVVLGA